MVEVRGASGPGHPLPAVIQQRPVQFLSSAKQNDAGLIALHAPLLTVQLR